DLERRQQVPAADPGGVCQQAPREAVAAAGGLDEPLVESVLERDIGGAGGREVALVGVVEPLLVADGVDQLGNQEVEVAVALAMAVGRLVDRDAVDRDAEVRAVVEVEAAQVILV